MNHDHFIVPPGKKIRLKDYDPDRDARRAGWHENIYRRMRLPLSRRGHEYEDR